MRLSFYSQTYETTLFQGIRLRLMMLWFPIRRLLRAIKRLAKRQIIWIVVLAIFIPTAGAMLYAICNAFSEESRFVVVFEVASIVLSSVVLLQIQEAIQKETERNLQLKRQWSFYSEIKSGLTTLTTQLASALGHPSPDWDLFNNQKTLNSYLASLGEVTIRKEPDTVISLLFDIRDYVNGLRNDPRSYYLIDCDLMEPCSRNSYLFESLDLSIKCDLDNLSKNESTKLEFEQLLNIEMAIIACTRRPWNYANDIAHRLLIKKVLETHGQKF